MPALQGRGCGDPRLLERAPAPLLQAVKGGGHNIAGTVPDGSPIVMAGIAAQEHRALDAAAQCLEDAAAEALRRCGLQRESDDG